MSADFAEHWAARTMPHLRRLSRLAAIRLITAAEDDLAWETFAAALDRLEQEAHRLGASFMPESYQRALHETLLRGLVDDVAAVQQPWAEAQLAAGLVAPDIERWDRQLREWAGLREAAERNIAPETPDNVPVGPPE